jgi:hypothetical protein
MSNTKHNHITGMKLIEEITNSIAGFLIDAHKDDKVKIRNQLLLSKRHIETDMIKTDILGRSLYYLKVYLIIVTHYHYTFY